MTLEELKAKFTETLQYRVAVLNKDAKYAAMLSEESMQKAGFTDMDTFAFYQISGWVPASDKTIAEILADADETTASRLIKSLNGGSKFMDYNEDGIAREDVESHIGSTDTEDLIKYDLDSDGDIDEYDLSTFSTVYIQTAINTPANTSPNTYDINPGSESTQPNTVDVNTSTQPNTAPNTTYEYGTYGTVYFTLVNTMVQTYTEDTWEDPNQKQISNFSELTNMMTKQIWSEKLDAWQAGNNDTINIVYNDEDDTDAAGKHTGINYVMPIDNDTYSYNYDTTYYGADTTMYYNWDGSGWPLSNSASNGESVYADYDIITNDTTTQVNYIVNYIYKMTYTKN